MYNIKETSLSASFSTWLVYGRTVFLNDYVILTYSNDKDLPQLRRSVLGVPVSRFWDLSLDQLRGIIVLSS